MCSSTGKSTVKASTIFKSQTMVRSTPFRSLAATSTVPKTRYGPLESVAARISPEPPRYRVEKSRAQLESAMQRLYVRRAHETHVCLRQQSQGQVPQVQIYVTIFNWVRVETVRLLYTLSEDWKLGDCVTPVTRSAQSKPKCSVHSKTR